MDNGEYQGKGTETRYLNANAPGAIAVAAELLRQGQLVVFPTDTVYGIGAQAFDARAVSRLYQVKRRPLHKGIPILLADLSDLEKVASLVPAAAGEYIDHFWPGPLTLIVPKHPHLPAPISPNEGIAVRIPDSTIARSLIRAAGGAIAASSANLSGRPPAHTGRQALRELGGMVAVVLDGGLCRQQVASTIVDCRGEKPVIVREGPISAASLSLARPATS